MANAQIMRFTLVLPISYMFLLFVVSSLPDTNASQNIMTEIPSALQNLLHVPAFGFLAVLWLFSLKYFLLSKRGTRYLAVILSMTYGGILEFYQAWVPGRFASVEDFLLNCIGILLAVLLSLIVSPRASHFFSNRKWSSS